MPTFGCHNCKADLKAFEEKMLKQFAGRPDAPKTIDEFIEKLSYEVENKLR